MDRQGPDTIAMYESAGLVMAPTPCPGCGAKNEAEANTMCRPSSDQTGEHSCRGNFNDAGISVQPTKESLAAMDAWIDGQVAAMEDDDRKRAERAARR